MAFSTVVGSDGITSLVGTTGTDVAAIFTLTENVFIGGNTGDDFVDIDLVPAAVATDYEIRMGGGDDDLGILDPISFSDISLDGETLANDGNDIFVATAVLESEVVGRGGNDKFAIGLFDNSELNGNTGNDFIDIRDSVDSEIYGGQGNDQIFTNGPSVETTIYGNKGVDTILIGFKADGTKPKDAAGTIIPIAFTDSAVYGGQGDDTIRFNSDSNIFASGDLGSDNIDAQGSGNNEIEGGDGNDTINTGRGNDDVDGGSGADIINTRNGEDTISGGAGKDIITAGRNADVYSGGADVDTFVIGNSDSNVGSNKSTGYDTITDFAGGTDKIDLTFAVTGYSAITPTKNTGGSSLSADLSKYLGGFNVGEAKSVTIGGAVDWAGSYIVVNTGAAGKYDQSDLVIQVASVTGVTAAGTFI